MAGGERSKGIVVPMPGGQMSEADNHATPAPHGQPVEFRVPARLESLAVIRALVTALGTLEDLDLDAVADLRLALDEACTALIRSAAADSRLTVMVQPREHDLWVSVSAPSVDDNVLRPGHLQLACHQFAHRRRGDVPRRCRGGRCWPGLRYHHDSETAGYRQVKESSSPRTRSEYADVPDMFREMHALAGRLVGTGASA